MKEQGETPEDELSDIEISNLPNKEFKVIIIKMPKELGRRMDGQSENFNRVREYKEEQNRAEEYNN